MRSILPKAGWMLAGVLALYVLSALAGVVTGGPLDPPGAPGPTLKTLGDIAPSWHQLLASDDGDPIGCNSTRFECVMNGTAVLDNETGLVWERVGRTDFEAITWMQAVGLCTFSAVGGRYGWRLPAIEELLTLTDKSADGIPDAWPFTVNLTAFYWSSTTVQDATASAYATILDQSDSGAESKTSGTHAALCVRGGYGYDSG